MSEVYLYILGANKNPDQVTCGVPELVPNDCSLIFFGPCEKKLREDLKGKFLKSRNRVSLLEDIYVVGMNAITRDRRRKINWVGKIREVMTFREAYQYLGSSVSKMRSFHVEPLEVGFGYKKRSGDVIHGEHEQWILDLVQSKHDACIGVENGKTIIRFSNEISELSRDCCLILESVFFANGKGLEISDEIVDTLKKAQGRSDVSSIAPFGRDRAKRSYGRRGSYLRLAGEDASRFISLLTRNIEKIREQNAIVKLSELPVSHDEGKWKAPYRRKDVRKTTCGG